MLLSECCQTTSQGSRHPPHKVTLSSHHLCPSLTTHPQPTHPLPLFYYTIRFSHFHGVLCLPPVYLLLWGSQPSQASGASKWLLLFDRLWCARNRGWNRIIMGKMVLVVICTGKCWPCCCFMYLFIPHTGKFVFNCVSCALAKRTLAQPHRIPFKPGDFFFASSWSPRNVSIALRTRGGEEGQISETTLKRSRISQLIFECCCCYFIFLGRVVSVTKP